MLFRHPFFWMACTLAALSPAASAVQVLLNPTQDAFVSSVNSGSNYGMAGALLIDSNNSSKGEFDSLLQFNLGQATSFFNSTFGTSNWVIQSITLTLTATMPSNNLFATPNAVGSFSLTWMQNDSWQGGGGTPASPGTSGITYATLPAFLSGSDEVLGSFNSPGTSSGNNTFNLNLTPNFLADATAGNAVSLLGLPTSATTVYTANSEDYSGMNAATSHPVLTVTAEVPEPATASLLAGGAMLGLLRRRRR